MKRLLTILVFLAILAALGYFSYGPVSAYLHARNQVVFREAEVVRGDILAVVNSTGKIEPILKVEVGSTVSGPIVELHVDFNQRVTKGELLAKIDPMNFEAAVERDKALLDSRNAELERARALYEQAVAEEKRALALRATREDYLSDTVMDQYKYARITLAAQCQAAEAAVKQAKANLVSSETNLDYTDITSPVDGIIIDRKIDPGQTLAAQFNTPQLFIVAPELDKRVHVFASVDEADIGLIRKAQEEERPVEFTVDAYPDDLFEGKIVQVRMNSSVEMNVVTYPVVVEAPNLDMKLLPGMTASLSFRLDKKEDILKVPNAALRFYPQRDHVHPDDLKILDGVEEPDDEDLVDEEERPAHERAESNKSQFERHVWYKDGEKLRAIKVTVGLMDYKYSELIEGDLKEGQKLVTGTE